ELLGANAQGKGRWDVQSKEVKNESCKSRDTEEKYVGYVGSN
ncbi:hypothetical protein F442_00138, partial [Phytophthora nicotianae P10297]